MMGLYLLSNVLFDLCLWDMVVPNKLIYFLLNSMYKDELTYPNPLILFSDFENIFYKNDYNVCDDMVFQNLWLTEYLTSVTHNITTL